MCAITGCPTQVALRRMLSLSKRPLLLISYRTLLRYFFFVFLGTELCSLYINTLDILHPTHSRFRGSVNCGALTMENSFQVAKYLFKVQKASSLFCLVQYCTAVIWVACIGLREGSKWSLRSSRAFSEAF